LDPQDEQSKDSSDIQQQRIDVEEILLQHHALLDLQKLTKHDSLSEHKNMFKFEILNVNFYKTYSIAVDLSRILEVNFNNCVTQTSIIVYQLCLRNLLETRI
jgi:hypothetical protein